VTLLLVAFAGLSQLVRGDDLARALDLVRRTGWPLLLVLLPTAVAMGLDAAGWRLILITLGARVPWLQMLELRVSVEALVLLMPGGAVAGEAAKAALLRDRTGTPLPRAVASQAVTKGYLLLTDGVYLALAAAWAAGERLAGRGAGSGLPAVGAAVLAAVVGVLGWLLVASLHHADLAARLARALQRLPSARFRAWIAERERGFVEIDASAREFFTAPFRDRLLVFGYFLAEWLTEAVETILIVRFLDIDLSLGSILILDALGSLLRVIVFFLPAGLGAQDAAIILLLRAMGVPDPAAAGAALVLVKRGKELIWIAAGSALALFRGAARPAAR
jgi:uncharacterized protein (TIRG00374 family)